MTFAELLLIASALLALASAFVTVIFRPNRMVTLVASAALLLLGLQQLGWSRAINSILLGERNYWLDLSLVCWLPVSLSWLFLSISLARGADLDRLRPWRIYFAIQAAASVAVVVALQWYSPIGRTVIGPGGDSLELTPFGVAVLAVLLLNISLASANVESTYVALSARWRRAFSAATLAIIFLLAWTTVFIASGILLGRVSLWDVAKSSIPFALLSIAIPYSLVRKRGVEATVTANVRPFYETLSFALGVGTLLVSLGIVQISDLTGWSLVRTVSITILCGTLLGIGALVVFGRLLHKVRRLLEPYLYTSRFDPEAVWTGLSHELDATSTHADVCRLMPARAAAITGVDPVTLFMALNSAPEYSVAGSTLQPAPVEVVGPEEPLARELRTSRHAIHLRGRADDLGMIPIYVENAKQIAACEAVCAVPLSHGGQLRGFILCGNPENGRENLAGTLLLLEVVAQMVATRLNSLERSE
ncbi:MAG TPA: hypothetical protein VET83_03365 [Candidatus Dormibacteraeota bacterium]|nr:hypothetical protein [Candidatus Dormibacteraeota bacterium]